MFHKQYTPQALNYSSKNTLVTHLGMVFTEIGEDYIKATLPVDERTFQPRGILHGGASVALAETLGSLAANMAVDPDKQYCVGLDINANHIKSVRSGMVEGTARPLHLGRSTHVWEIKIVNEKKELTCVSRITMAVLDKKDGAGANDYY